MRFLIHTAVIVLLCTLCSYTGHSAGLIDVTASVDKQTAYIGDLIEYTIVITYDSTLQLTPPPAGANLGGFEVKDYDFGVEETMDDGRHQQAIHFFLRTFTTGDYVIPSLPIEYMTPDSTLKYISADPIKIFIKSVLAEGVTADSLEPRPLKGQASLTGRSWTIWIILGLVLIAAAFALYYFLRKKQTREEIPYMDPRPSWEIAFADLAVLKNGNLLKQGEIKQFYLELSEIMKKYMGGKFEFDAIDMTTAEISDALSGVSDNEEFHHEAITFLEHADLVKFAKYVPPADRPDIDWDAAYELVSRSKDMIVIPPVRVEPEPVAVMSSPGEIDEEQSDLRFAPPELRQYLSSEEEEDTP